MVRRMIRAAVFSFLATGAAFNAGAGYAGDCFGGGRGNYYAPAYGAEFHFCPPSSVALTPLEAYQLLRKHPHLAKRHPDLTAQLEAKFGSNESVTAPVVVESRVGAADPTAIPTLKRAGAPANGVIDSVASVAVPSAGVSVPEPQLAPNLSPSRGVPANATLGAAPSGGNDAADPLAPGLDASLPPAAPPVDAARAAAATPPLRPELEPLLGLWQTVAIDPNGDQKVTQVNLSPDGTATLTVDSTLGKVSFKRPFAIDDQTKTFQLNGEGDPIVLGKVVSADKDQVVLERDGANVTFTRP